MGVSWDGTSNVWLRILFSLQHSPVVVEMTTESGVWVSVPWDWASDVRLWVLIGLSQGPVIVEVAGEG